MEVCRGEGAALCGQAQAHLGTLLREAQAEPCLLLVSGGSALAALPGAVSADAASALTLGLIDERIGEAPEETNGHKLAGTPFFASCRNRGAGVLPDIAPLEVTQAERAYEAALRTWRAAHPRGRIIATLGMGADGHTAGMLPFPDDEPRFAELFLSGAWVRGYDAGAKNPFPRRVTVTMHFLKREVHSTLVYIAGAGKREAYAAFVAPRGALHRTPARIIRDMQRVTIFTDSDYDI